MKVATAVAALAGLAVAAAAPLTEDQTQFLFTRFVQQYDKNYETNSFFSKYNTFKANLNTIIAHNAKGESYTMAANEHTDLTWEQFSARMGLKLINRPHSNSVLAAPVAVSASRVNGNPEVVDWREKGVVLENVKNQGQCGSCWAFSAVAAIESAYAIAHDKLFDLSESQLVDCAGSYGNEGCNGGLMDSAFEYVIAEGGLCSTKEYPYTPADSECKADSCTRRATLRSYKKVRKNDEAHLQQSLKAAGVISVAVAANSNFQFYSSGIFDGPCSTTALNHGVALVGYSIHTTRPKESFYVVRNSWGASWGEKGYIRLSVGKNTCGIAADATSVYA